MPVSKKPRKKSNLGTRLKREIDASDRRYARSVMAPDQSRDIGIAAHVAFDQMRNGAGSEEHFSTLACITNISLILAENGLGSDHLDGIRHALDGIERVRQRGETVGRWMFDGDGLAAMEAALAVHDAQIEAATISETRKALAEVARRLDQPLLKAA